MAFSGTWWQWEAGDGDHVWRGLAPSGYCVCSVQAILTHPGPRELRVHPQLLLWPTVPGPHSWEWPLLSDVGDEGAGLPLPRTQPTLE